MNCWLRLDLAPIFHISWARMGTVHVVAVLVLDDCIWRVVFQCILALKFLTICLFCFNSTLTLCRNIVPPVQSSASWYAFLRDLPRWSASSLWTYLTSKSSTIREECDGASDMSPQTGRVGDFEISVWGKMFLEGRVCELAGLW